MAAENDHCQVMFPDENSFKCNLYSVMLECDPTQNRVFIKLALNTPLSNFMHCSANGSATVKKSLLTLDNIFISN
ncbi:hypothetical protein HR45_04015 [Shewanella mangrovi]|uniref:Uncharacterized protein n=1 Tax=Shewanella mangrovi TaxID=1515746 RepID=A0A094JH84_9GAMM|nr:hypothetical protein HR45_04015 [Shewanella mangrovi]